jgi:hypothetical protein
VLRGTKQHSSLEFIKLEKKYGSVVTFWIGHIPFVIIFDSDIARDALKQNAFSGRPETQFGINIKNLKQNQLH